MTTALKRALYASFAVLALGGLLAASVALAGTLPADGVWFYDNTATLNVTPGHAALKARVRFHASSGSNIFALEGWVIGGKCKKRGRTMDAGTVGYNTPNKHLIPIRADGSFSGKWHTRSGVRKMAATVSGVFHGTHLSGTITAHTKDPLDGDCTATGKFIRVEGESAY